MANNFLPLNNYAPVGCKTIPLLVGADVPFTNGAGQPIISKKIIVWSVGNIAVLTEEGGIDVIPVSTVPFLIELAATRVFGTGSGSSPGMSFTYLY